MKILALVYIISFSVFFTVSSQANTVTLTVENNSAEKIDLSAGSPYGLPALVPPKTTKTVILEFGGTRSDITATYQRFGNKAACKFTASHIVKGQNSATFNKSAAQSGTIKATCRADQSPNYTTDNYSATFAVY
jgi:uncharacterized protein (UPF0333 family)